MFKVEFRTDSGKDKLIREKKYIDDAIGLKFIYIYYSAYILNKTKEVDKIIKRHEEQLEEHAKSSIERPLDV